MRTSIPHPLTSAAARGDIPILLALWTVLVRAGLATMTHAEAVLATGCLANHVDLVVAFHAHLQSKSTGASVPSDPNHVDVDHTDADNVQSEVARSTDTDADQQQPSTRTDPDRDDHDAKISLLWEKLDLPTLVGTYAGTPSTLGALIQHCVVASPTPTTWDPLLPLFLVLLRSPRADLLPALVPHLPAAPAPRPTILATLAAGGSSEALAWLHPLGLLPSIPKQGTTTPDLWSAAAMTAAESGHLHLLANLLHTSGRDPIQLVDSKGRTLAHAAARGGHAHILRWLLEHGYGSLWTAVDCHHHTILHEACREGHGALLGMLLANKHLRTLVNVADSRLARVPLHVACGRGDPACVAPLVHVPHTNVGARDHLGRTPLLTALLGGHETVAELLLRARGAACDIGAGDVRGYPALHVAVEKGLQRSSLTLLGLGADPYATVGVVPVMAVDLAGSAGLDHLVRIMRQRQPQPQPQPQQQRSPRTPGTRRSPAPGIASPDLPRRSTGLARAGPGARARSPYLEEPLVVTSGSGSPGDGDAESATETETSSPSISVPGEPNPPRISATNSTSKGRSPTVDVHLSIPAEDEPLPTPIPTAGASAAQRTPPSPALSLTGVSQWSDMDDTEVDTAVKTVPSSPPSAEMKAAQSLRSSSRRTTTTTITTTTTTTKQFPPPVTLTDASFASFDQGSPLALALSALTPRRSPFRDFSTRLHPTRTYSEDGTTLSPKYKRSTGFASPLLVSNPTGTPSPGAARLQRHSMSARLSPSPTRSALKHSSSYLRGEHDDRASDDERASTTSRRVSFDVHFTSDLVGGTKEPCTTIAISSPVSTMTVEESVRRSLDPPHSERSDGDGDGDLAEEPEEKPGVVSLQVPPAAHCTPALTRAQVPSPPPTPSMDLSSSNEKDTEKSETADMSVSTPETHNMPRGSPLVLDSAVFDALRTDGGHLQPRVAPRTAPTPTDENRKDVSGLFSSVDDTMASLSATDLDVSVFPVSALNTAAATISTTSSDPSPLDRVLRLVSGEQTPRKDFLDPAPVTSPHPSPPPPHILTPLLAPATPTTPVPSTSTSPTTTLNATTSTAPSPYPSPAASIASVSSGSYPAYREEARMITGGRRVAVRVSPEGSRPPPPGTVGQPNGASVLRLDTKRSPSPVAPGSSLVAGLPTLRPFAEVVQEHARHAGLGAEQMGGGKRSSQATATASTTAVRTSHVRIDVAADPFMPTAAISPTPTSSLLAKSPLAQLTDRLGVGVTASLAITKPVVTPSSPVASAPAPVPTTLSPHQISEQPNTLSISSATETTPLQISIPSNLDVHQAQREIEALGAELARLRLASSDQLDQLVRQQQDFTDRLTIAETRAAAAVLAASRIAELLHEEKGKRKRKGKVVGVAYAEVAATLASLGGVSSH